MKQRSYTWPEFVEVIKKQGKNEKLIDHWRLEDMKAKWNVELDSFNSKQEERKNGEIQIKSGILLLVTHQYQFLSLDILITVIMPGVNNGESR